MPLPHLCTPSNASEQLSTTYMDMDMDDMGMGVIAQNPLQLVLFSLVYFILVVLWWVVMLIDSSSLTHAMPLTGMGNQMDFHISFDVLYLA